MATNQIKVDASDRINNVAIKEEPNEIEWNPVIVSMAEFFKTDEISREEYLEVMKDIFIIKMKKSRLNTHVNVNFKMNMVVQSSKGINSGCVHKEQLKQIKNILVLFLMNMKVTIQHLHKEQWTWTNSIRSVKTLN